jgi:uncharacterized protein (TIGR00725 family)
MSHRKLVVGVMGGGNGTLGELHLAQDLGRLIAEQGWVLLTGGRNVGVMHAASAGAKSVPGSLTIGVLPFGSDPNHTLVSPDVDVAIFTGLGDARNVVNVLSSDVVVACGGGGPGTASEAALALKSGKPLILLAPSAEASAFFLGLDPGVRVAASAAEVITIISAKHAPV